MVGRTGPVCEGENITTAAERAAPPYLLLRPRSSVRTINKQLLEIHVGREHAQWKSAGGAHDG
jgi:hypothetical protein